MSKTRLNKKLGRELTPAELKKYKPLFLAAKKGWQNSYAPYSKFHVGSAVVTKGGDLFSGCNIENASYGGSVCAERVAILKAKSEAAQDIAALAVVTNQKELIPPCALCLQTMAEFAEPEMPVLLGDLNGLQRLYYFRDLLACPFGPKFLKKYNTESKV